MDTAHVPPDPAADYWTVTDVARYLGVTLGTVSAYAHRRQMPDPDRVYGKTRLWQPSRIIEWHRGRPLAGRRDPDT